MVTSVNAVARSISTAKAREDDQAKKNDPVKIIYGRQTAVAQGSYIVRCTPTVALLAKPNADNYTKELAVATFDEDYIPGEPPSDSWVSKDNRVIQCYRTVQLFSQCTTTKDDTLCACYYVMDDSDQDIVTRLHYIDKLKRSYFKKVNSARECLFREKIPDYTVDKLLGALIASRIMPNIDELLMEIDKGRINRTPQVDTILEALPTDVLQTKLSQY